MDAAMLASRAFWRLVLAAVASAMLLASYAGTPTALAATLPPQGIFESCPLDGALATCEQRLGVMHSGGLQVVVTPPSGASLDSLSQYTAAAHGLGMSVLWELSDAAWWQQPSSGTGAATDFSQFATACGCSTNGAVLAFMTHWLGSLPGTYGYYAADDSMIGPNDQPGITSYVAQIKQTDPGHPIMIGAANGAQRHQYQGTVDLAAQEFYPVSTSSLLPASANQSTWDSIDQAAADTQSTADHAGKASAVILQAFTWGDNVDDGRAIGVCNSADTTASCNAKLRYPSGTEQLALRDAVLRNSHPQLILWWSFQGTYGYAQDPGSYFATPSPAEAASRWAGLSAAIQAPFPARASGVGIATGARVRQAAIKTSVHKQKRRKHHHGAKRARRHKHHRTNKRRAAH
jgi:hypothetical protein